MARLRIFLGFFSLVLTFQQNTAFGTGLKRALYRGAARSASHSLRLNPAQMRWMDLARHLRTAPKPLVRGRTVHRYTSRMQAGREMKRGIAPNRHMTAVAKPGRPLSSAHAQQRYGLPRVPQLRETIRLQKGFTVRHNRATAGGRGVGELTSSRRVPPRAIQKVTPLKKAPR